MAAATPIPADPAAPAGETDGGLVRVYVWEWPVRAAHWGIALSLVVLSATGIYLGAPFLSIRGAAGEHFATGTAKAIHVAAGFVFVLSFVSRILWMFVGNVYARWDKLVPVRKKRRDGLIPTFLFYVFKYRKPPAFVGHNPLAGLTYTAVYGLCAVMVVTGLALYAVTAPAGSPFRLFSFLVPLAGGLQTARFVHHVVMWLLLGFGVHHVYSALLVSHVERIGTIESIFSGWKFVPRDHVVPTARGWVDRLDAEPRDLR